MNAWSHQWVKVERCPRPQGHICNKRSLSPSLSPCMHFFSSSPGEFSTESAFSFSANSRTFFCVVEQNLKVLPGGKQLFGAHTHFQREYNDRLWAREKNVKAEKRDGHEEREREKETFRRQRHHQSWLMMGWRLRRNVSFSPSSCLSLFSAFTLFSRAHNRALYFPWESESHLPSDHKGLA